MADIKFLADEHIKFSAVRGLASKGTDILPLNERGLSDLQIIRLAAEEGRVIVTMDKDFLRLASSGEKHKGIVFITHPVRTGEIIRELEKIALLYSSEDMENSIFYIPAKY